MDEDKDKAVRVQTRELPFLLQIPCVVEETLDGELLTCHVQQCVVSAPQTLDSERALRIKFKRMELTELTLRTALDTLNVKRQLMGEGLAELSEEKKLIVPR